MQGAMIPDASNARRALSDRSSCLRRTAVCAAASESEWIGSARLELTAVAESERGVWLEPGRKCDLPQLAGGCGAWSVLLIEFVEIVVRDRRAGTSPPLD